jgi:hypothetical protein
MKQDWADHQLWVKLAKLHGHQLVPSHMNCSKKNILHICKVLNISVDDFKDNFLRCSMKRTSCPEGSTRNDEKVV